MANGGKQAKGKGKGHGLDTSWTVNVKCKCGTGLTVAPRVLNEHVVRYTFECVKCNVSGNWEDLAKGYLYGKNS